MQTCDQTSTIATKGGSKEKMLTFAFALACAAAHAAPKSGISEESTYEYMTGDWNASTLDDINQNATCNSHLGVDWGQQPGNLM